MNRRWARMAARVALAMGCTLGAGAARAQAPAQTLRVAVGQKGNWDTSIMDYGIKEGFFRDEGLTIQEVYTPGGAPTLQAVISGSADIGIGTGLLGTIGAFARGAPVRVIQNETKGAADLFWYATAKSGLHDLKGAAGQTIAYSEPGSSTNLVLLALLAQAGVTTAHTVAAGGIPATLTQVMSGQIAVGWSVPPANLQAVEDKTLVIIARGGDAASMRDETVRVNVANAESLRTRADAIARWRRAYRRSYEWAYSNPKAIDDFAEGMGVPRPLAQTSRDDFYPKAALDPDALGGLPTALQQAADFHFTPALLTEAQAAPLFAPAQGK